MEKIRTRALLLTITLLTFLISFFFIVILQDKQNILNQKINSHRQLVDNSYELSIADTEKRLSQFAFNLVSDSAILDAFSARDRDTLFTLAIPYFNEANARGDVDLAGFIQSDGHHFLRLTDPKKFGDDIAKKRPMIALALKEQKAITSMDVTLYNISIVSIVPIFNKGKFLGILQISSKIERLQNRLNLRSGIKSALAFDSKKIAALMPEKRFQTYGSFSIISSNDTLFEY
jgi:hypothetical protein